MKHKIILLIIISSLQSYVANAQMGVLRNKIEQITKGKNAKVGVAVLDLKGKDTLTINGTGHFPMQSVFKFHLALAVLNQVDKGKFSLNQKIFVKKSELKPNWWSPLRDKYPNGDVNLPLSELLSFTVSQSDNNGCDILFKLLGGPKKVHDYIHSLGIKDVAILTTMGRTDGVLRDLNACSIFVRTSVHWTTVVASVCNIYCKYLKHSKRSGMRQTMASTQEQ